MPPVLSPLLPLDAEPPLRVLVTGRARAGKSTLVAHLKRYTTAPHALAAPPAQRLSAAPLSTSDSSLFVAQHRPRRRLSFLLHRVLHALSTALTPQPVASHCAVHHVVHLQHAHAVRIWESVGQHGVSAVAADPQARQLDVILFVTRLDCSRVAKYDKEHLSHLCHLFGQQVLDNIIFVLTRGASLPPINLSFTEFVTLRSDFLYLQVKQVFYPVQRSGGVGIKHAPELVSQHLQNRQTPSSQPELTEAALARLEKSITREWLRRKPTAAVDTLQSILANDDSTDAGSTSALPDTFLDDLFLSGVYPLDRRVFEDPPRPPTVVVELAESAPTNEDGHVLLPDGSAWIHHLVQTMVSTANRVRARRQALDQAQEQQSQYKPPPLNWWRRLLREFVCGGIRTAVMSVTFMYLGWYTYAQILDRRRKWKAAQDDDDVLLKLDQDEFERRTKPDPGTDGSVILSSEPEQEEEEELKDEEKEFFGAEQQKAGEGKAVDKEPVDSDTPEVRGVGPLYEKQARDKDGNTTPQETKGGDVHVDWDKLDDGEEIYTQSYTLENEHKWKHLVPKDD